MKNKTLNYELNSANSKIVNSIIKFGVSLSIDLPIIEAFASVAYNFLDGKGVEQEIAFQRLMDYYSSIGDAKQRELEIKKDTEGLKKNDPKTQDKIMKIAKNEYGDACLFRIVPYSDFVMI
jgi:hypothetical protein